MHCRTDGEARGIDGIWGVPQSVAVGIDLDEAREVREDAGCVIHLHTPDGTAVATSSTGLLPLNQTAQLVLPDRDEGYNCARAYLETDKSKVVKLAARLVERGGVDAAEFLRLME